jgi:hypothetical protein
MTPRGMTGVWGVAVLTLVVLGGPAAAQPVTTQYTATATTIVGSPFGYTTTAGIAPITGFFTYNRATADTNASAQRGDYPHTGGGGAFQAVITNGTLNRTITGSGTPFVQIEDLNPDTFRFIDGPRPVGPQGGTMSVNGTPNTSVQLLLAMTDSSGNAFTNDSLPASFPFARPPLANPAPTFPHTFSLVDSGGTLLLQFTSLQPVPEPSVLALTLLGPAAYVIARRRARRKSAAGPISP